MAQHEQEVAAHCEAFLLRLNAQWSRWGDVVGRWHDLGKYQPDFQRKLHGERLHVPHAAIGAALAASLKSHSGIAAAFAIAGHHTGLADFQETSSSRTPLQQAVRDAQTGLTEVKKLAPPSLLAQQLPALPGFVGQPPLAPPGAANRPFAFFTRMLFSALVDADRLATAAFYAKANGQPVPTASLQYDDIPTLCRRLDAHVDGFASDPQRRVNSAVNQLRAEVLSACRAEVNESPGLFSLTVPTGGGKTLSSMSFALRHAMAHGLDRVIVVIPYTSIIEQNAKVYREALGAGNVLEHHSGIDEEKRIEQSSEDERRRQLAAENWDAPVVVTTSVQFFESLFSDHPSRCRKLHRIAKSVVILDEVQTLPPQFLLPIVESLRELTNHYGCTVVLSTATPPALEHRPGLLQGLTGIRHIIPDPVRLFRSPAAQRVTIEWRTDHVTPYSELAGELTEQQQVLAIVHSRPDARRLSELLPTAGRFHLSAAMCPAHRLQRIEEIRAALKAGRPCRVVSTQLIEAGVDVDFPVVYRALAGLDSIAQSAGRCDREGKLTERAGRPAGRFVVFEAETMTPSGTLRKAFQSTQFLLGLQDTEPALGGRLDPFNPDHGILFFNQLYGRENLDAMGVEIALSQLNFAQAASKFQIIDNQDLRPLVVPWRVAQTRIDNFRHDPSRKNARALQPFIVQVTVRMLAELTRLGAVEMWEEYLALPTPLFGDRYSADFGLEASANSATDPSVLIV